MAQSSFDAFLKHYVFETEEKIQQEFETYFNSFNENVIKQFTKSTSISTGHCKNIYSLVSKFKVESIDSDCKQQEDVYSASNIVYMLMMKILEKYLA